MTEPMVLELRHLTRSFGSLSVLRGVDLTCGMGEIVAVVGKNGSGKSTLVRCISGQLRHDGGQLFLEGKELRSEAAWERARGGLSWTFQDVAAPLTLSPREMLSLAREGNASAKGVLEAELEPFADQPWITLSFGQRKLTQLVVALARNPRLLLLDEPVAGLAPRIVLLVGDALRDVAAGGAAVMIIEHNREFVSAAAHRLHVLAAGMIRISGPPEEVFGADETLEALL
jgi:branched-chain amino acid transport system ATP-binding protein